MKQPIRKIKPKSKPVVTKSKIKEEVTRTRTKPTMERKTSNNGEKTQKYGTSKLEKYFAKEFLDKNHIKYIYEYEAKDIKRFYDFAVVAQKVDYIMEEKEGLNSVKEKVQYTPIEFLIEIDGGYWHSDPRLFDESELNYTQKKNKYIDKLKDKWARDHALPLLRIWEYDIHNNPQKVLETLRQYVAFNLKKKSTKTKYLKKTKKRLSLG